jgi:methionyl-tRNA synthetase
MEKLTSLHAEITTSLERHRYKEALRNVMRAAQLGNQMLQAATPWKFLKDLDGDGAKESMAKLSFGWRVSRFLSIMTQPFLPFSAQKLWTALGEDGEVSQVSWDSSIDWNTKFKWSEQIAEPLFKRLDLDEILVQEKELASGDTTSDNDPTHGVKGSKKSKKEERKMPEGTTYLDFETFMEVELKVGKITNVEDHENADKLYVVTIEDGTENGRTICAGLKEYYSPEQMVGKSVVFVANLKPRKLRGVMSEGMMLAADDGKGGVNLVTIDGDISPGSQVR